MLDVLWGQSTMTGIRSWWVGRRNALLSSARFQRLSLGFWPTRLIARRHARRLFDLVAGFTYSQTLFACIELNLIERLSREPMARDAIAAVSDLSAEATQRLVLAAEAIGLFEQLPDGRVALGQAGAALAGNPGASAMIAHHRHLYADLADPVALFRRGGGGGELAAFWAYARGSSPEAVGAYSTLMAASHAPVAALVLDAYDVSRHRRLLDVGGGEGVFLGEVARRAPGVERALFDLPAVAERARAQLGDSVAVHCGDFFADPLPAPYDCITLMRVLHDHDDAAALALLTSIRAALAPGGVLLIGEPMIERHDARVGATYFGLYLLALGSGRARSHPEIAALLEAAGFRHRRTLRTALPLVASVIIAQP